MGMVYAHESKSRRRGFPFARAMYIHLQLPLDDTVT